MMSEVIASPTTLEECEAIIHRGVFAWKEAAAALVRIREERLFAPEFPNFTAYLAERWQFSRSRAYQLIAAFQDVHTVDTEGTYRRRENEARRLAAPKITVSEPTVDAEVTPVPQEEPEDVEDTAGDPPESEIGSEEGAGDEIGCLPTESSPPAAIVCSDAEGVLASDISVEWVDGTMSVYVVNAVTEAMWRELEAFCRTQYDETPPARTDFPAWTPPPVNTHGAPPAADLEAVRRTLEAHPNEPLTTTEVAKFAHVSPPRTADALRWLESNEHDVSQKGRCWMLRKVTA